MASAFISFMTLAAVVVFVYGLYLFVFRRGRRKRGLFLAFTALVGWPTLIIAYSLAEANYTARQSGFESSEDRERAREAGFSDAAAWAVEREKRDEGERERAAIEQAKEEMQRNLAKAEEKRKGFHCLSAWDGTHYDINREVEKAMREPDSFEHIETAITPVGEDGFHLLRMRYRARNGFGGMSVGSAVARVRNQDCAFEIISLD